MWAHSPLRAAVTLPFTRCRYCRTPAIAIAQACDIHDDDDDDNDNDNAWQRGPLWPHGMGPKIGFKLGVKQRGSYGWRERRWKMEHKQCYKFPHCPSLNAFSPHPSTTELWRLARRQTCLSIRRLCCGFQLKRTAATSAVERRRHGAASKLRRIIGSATDRQRRRRRRRWLQGNGPSRSSNEIR